MPKVWIGKVEVPNQVLPNVPFDIYWRDWFLVWPFKEYRIISKISREGDIVDYSYKLKHWWFWGSRAHIATEWNGIEDDTDYTIEVGYDG